jgi:hypothetical protein
MAPIIKHYSIKDWCSYEETQDRQPSDSMTMQSMLSCVMGNLPCVVTTYLDDLTGDGYETREFRHYIE